jgi:hypothetical protein
MREPWHHSGEVSYFHESNSKSSWEKCGELKICGRNGVLWVRLRDPVQSTGGRRPLEGAGLAPGRCLPCMHGTELGQWRGPLGLWVHVPLKDGGGTGPFMLWLGLGQCVKVTRTLGTKKCPGLNPSSTSVSVAMDSLLEPQFPHLRTARSQLHRSVRGSQDLAGVQGCVQVQHSVGAW